jgi:TolB-like protein/Flp pilus assembly protein TadD
VVDAVRCAIEVQNGLAERNAGLPPERRIEFRVGIHLGDVVEEEDGDLMGDGVNIAARLEGIAKPGAICLSEQAYWQVKARFELAVRDFGAIQLKNIAEPIHVYSLELGQPAQARFKTGVTNARFGQRWPVIVAALALALSGAGAYAWHAGFAPRLVGQFVAADKLATAPRCSIVVLPFENLSGDPDQEYFVDGITDDLTTDLSHIADSFVIARNTAFTYKGRPIDAKAIGRELGVRYLLEGSVRRTGETIEVNAQLVSTETGAHVWADRFEGERRDLGKLQFEVVARIAHSLGEELVKAESLQAIRERPKNPDAVDLATRGEAILVSNNINKPAWNEAINLFERTLALDPQNMTALTGLAIALDVHADNHWSQDPAADMVRAGELTNAAMALQPDDTWVHWVKGRQLASQQQWRSALTEAEASLAADRNNARAYADAGFYKMHLGRSEDGIADIETALRLSPHENQVPEWQLHLCYSHDFLGQWEQAIEWCSKAATNNVAHGYPLAALAGAYSWAGQDKEAKDVAAQLLDADPNFTVQVLQHRVSDDPTFNSQMDRIVEGLRKVGLPDGPAKTN